MQEDTMISEEALQIAEKSRDVKGKGEKERSIHLNAEFPTIARRGKKGFPFLQQLCSLISSSEMQAVFHVMVVRVKTESSCERTFKVVSPIKT